MLIGWIAKNLFFPTPSSTKSVAASCKLCSVTHDLRHWKSLSLGLYIFHFELTCFIYVIVLGFFVYFLEKQSWCRCCGQWWKASVWPPEVSLFSALTSSWIFSFGWWDVAWKSLRNAFKVSFIMKLLFPSLILCLGFSVCWNAVLAVRAQEQAVDIEVGLGMGELEWVDVQTFYLFIANRSVPRLVTERSD